MLSIVFWSLNYVSGGLYLSFFNFVRTVSSLFVVLNITDKTWYVNRKVKKYFKKIRIGRNEWDTMLSYQIITTNRERKSICTWNTEVQMLFLYYQSCISYAFCASRAARQAFASWSPQEVGRPEQEMPESFSSTCSTVRPCTSFGMAFRLPLHPPVNLTSFTICPSSSTSIIVEQVPFVLYK